MRCAEDPRLAEFLRLMQPRHKTAVWADEPLPPQQQQQGASDQQPKPEQGQRQKQSRKQGPKQSRVDPQASPASADPADELDQDASQPGAAWALPAPLFLSALLVNVQASMCSIWLGTGCMTRDLWSSYGMMVSGDPWPLLSQRHGGA